MSLAARGIPGTSCPTQKARKQRQPPKKRTGRLWLGILASCLIALAIDVCAFGTSHLPGLAHLGQDESAYEEQAAGISATSPSPTQQVELSAEGEAACGQSAHSALGDEGVDAQASTQDWSSVYEQLFSKLATSEVVHGNSQVTALLHAEVPDAAQELLSSYQASSHCLLAHEGYLDLSGRAWGCVIQGEGWVDVAVMQEQSDQSCHLSITRMHVDAWAEDPEGFLEEVPYAS